MKAGVREEPKRPEAKVEKKDKTRKWETRKHRHRKSPGGDGGKKMKRGKKPI